MCVQIYMSQTASLTYSCPMILVCITCAESENNRICAPKTLIKNQEDLFETNYKKCIYKI